MTSGSRIDPASVLTTVFNERYDEMVLVRNIRYTSLCEHHLLPFSGEMTVGYVPGAKVVGLSKIPRLVEVISRRASMQERVTREVADTMARVLGPLGVGVVARAHHSCMGCRGVRQPDADMVTSSLLGCLRDGPARAEFLHLAGLRAP
jgi:GTP cyclohydrolase I